MIHEPVKVAVLLSGSGRTLDNFLTHIQNGSLSVDIVAVVASRPNIKGIEIARNAGIPCKVFSRRKYESTSEHNTALNSWLMKYQPALIALAGYLSFYVSPSNFAGPVVNIHPALLPKYGGKGFYGNHVHRAVLEAGDSESGCTVHLVDDQYDTGKILGQKRVPVLPEDDPDSLASRVFAAESQLYPQILAQLASEIADN